MEQGVDDWSRRVGAIRDPIGAFLEPKPTCASEIWVGAGRRKEGAPLGLDPLGSLGDGIT